MYKGFKTSKTMTVKRVYIDITRIGLIHHLRLSQTPSDICPLRPIFRVVKR